MRSAGILMHISSLPSKYGIGTLGEESYKFVDFLKSAGQRWWQVLPVCPTSYGDSPYQSNSAFAGNPYFIDLDILRDEGLLKQSEIDNYYFFEDDEFVDYKRLFEFRYPLLRQAFARFEKDDEYERFVSEQAFWLYDYALFMSIKEDNHFKPWYEWDADIQLAKEEVLCEYRQKQARRIEFYMFIQYKFYSQWRKLKAYANQNGIGIIGDMPIYVALDSAEVWKNPELFDLNNEKKPNMIAGVPPDYFSEDGQVWGNPLYNWERMANDGYAWWIRRIKSSFELFDKVRIDHFRGFEAYYSIPYGAKNAKEGVWQKGPGMDLFNAVKGQLGDVDIIAEDLGFLTDEVHKLLADSGYPGMRVLQFGFNPYEDNMYLCHNLPQNCVAYTGTHDNDTFVGWFSSLKGEQKQFAIDYLGTKRKNDVCESAIRLLMASRADLVIVPICDWLKKDSKSRMNTPSTIGDNWRYRAVKDDFTDKLAEEILKITKAYKRIK